MNFNRLFSGMFGLFFVLVLLNVGVGFSALCSDSDPSDDIHIYGKMVVNNSVFYDQCSDLGVIQYSCSGDGYSYSKKDFPCGADEGCFSAAPGKCIKLICSDSDGGYITDKKGTATIGETGNSFSVTDQCEDSNKLIEYFCSKTDSGLVIGAIGAGYTCPNGCVDGACVKAEVTCSDSDGGSNPMKTGSVTITYTNGSKVVVKDYCNGNTAAEYTCISSPPYFIENPQFCDPELSYTCDAGACRKSDLTSFTVLSCSETDAGNDLVVKGETTFVKTNGNKASYIDYCVSDQVLQEYYCKSSTEVVFSKKKCPSNSICKNDTCVSATPGCNDSDGGQVITKKGTVTTTKAGVPKTYTDSCKDTGNVVEYICNKGGAGGKVLKCLGTSTCVDGACVTATGNSSANLKKTKLRDFLLSPGWRVDAASLISSIFQSNIE